jgi:hypothetical protein
VFAHYTGKLQSGEVFDSTTGKPHRAKHGFYFTPGAGEVIQGWDVVRASLSLSLRPVPRCQRLRAARGCGRGLCSKLLPPRCCARGLRR